MNRPYKSPFNVEYTLSFPGVKIIQDFISEEEERDLMNSIDEVPWDLSQSGRRKQVKIIDVSVGNKSNLKAIQLNNNQIRLQKIISTISHKKNYHKFWFLQKTSAVWNCNFQ